MPILFQADNNVWYKKATDEEKAYKKNINNAIDHALGKKLNHTLEQISGTDKIKNELNTIYTDLNLLRTEVKTNSTQIDVLNKTELKIHHMEKKLFYNAWFFKNASYDFLEFDTFEDESKLFHGKITDGKLVPENKKSIYRSIKFLPKLTKPITRYMAHVEYITENGGGLVVEISFDNGNKYHTILSTVQDPNVAYYYQYPDFCNCDNSVPELDADSFIIRFRLFANKEKSGVFVSSYGIMRS